MASTFVPVSQPMQGSLNAFCPPGTWALVGPAPAPADHEGPYGIQKDPECSPVPMWPCHPCAWDASGCVIPVSTQFIPIQLPQTVDYASIFKGPYPQHGTPMLCDGNVVHDSLMHNASWPMTHTGVFCNGFIQDAELKMLDKVATASAPVQPTGSVKSKSGEIANAHQLRASAANSQNSCLPYRSESDRPVGMLEQLQSLQEENPHTVLIARRLHPLGFGSVQMLEEYFGVYGPVKDILVPDSRVKASPGRRARARPASIGFVVMLTAKAAQLALADGDLHTIGGHPITVQAFEKRERDVGQDDGGSAKKEHVQICSAPTTASSTPLTRSTTPGETYQGGRSHRSTTPESRSDADSESDGASRQLWADICDEEMAHGHDGFACLHGMGESGKAKVVNRAERRGNTSSHGSEAQCAHFQHLLDALVSGVMAQNSHSKSGGSVASYSGGGTGGRKGKKYGTAGTAWQNSHWSY